MYYFLLYSVATCERCGAVGIKHAFYSKSKRFCSLHCSKMAKEDEYDDYKDSKIPVCTLIVLANVIPFLKIFKNK